MNMNRRYFGFLWALAALPMTIARAETPKPQPTAADQVAIQKSIDQGIAFLKNAQAQDGSWTAATSPGITGIAVFALLQSGVSPDDAKLAKALQHLESFRQPDGGIYYLQTPHKNYETSISLLAFVAANRNGKYDALIDSAKAFLKKIQWDEEEGADPTNPAYGGAGYGKSQRPDLSNTAFFLEALRAAGVPADDPSMKRAAVFVSRCQNLESAHNTTPFAVKVKDGGFYYTPVGSTGNSQAGLTADGGLRSYASMTYAGLKSMIYAGLKADDPRVKAASDWIRKFYSVSENPGLGQQGLFYYYHTFGKTMTVLKIDRFEDEKGQAHDWRAELSAEVMKRQSENGSWMNPTDRWFEGDPNLVTAYALLALDQCRPAK